MFRTMTHAALAALLGASLLLAAPDAEAKEKKEKWWKGGGKGNHRSERVIKRERVERRDGGDRVVRRQTVRRDRGDRVVSRRQVIRRDRDRVVSRPEYRRDRVVSRPDYRRDRVVSRKVVRRDRDRIVRTDRVIRTYPRGGFDRQWRSWQGRRVYRDVIVIRNASRGPRYRAWRAYCAPEYSYAQRIVYVRPVRFYVAASGVIGGVHISAHYQDCDDYRYGCNFCDLHFASYAGYMEHVHGCGYRPTGYRVVCHDWDAPSHGGWWDDRHWDDGDDAYYDDEYYDDGY